MEDKVEIDVADAEEMLKKARVHLDRDEARKARDLSVRAENVVRDRLALAHSAQKALDFADRSVTKARKARVDTKKAEDLLMRARRAMRNNEFYDAISLSEKAVAATTIQPLPGKEITVKTVFARVEQRVLYKVLLRNNLAQTIDGIMVIPDTSNSVFVPYPESAVVDLGPNGEETVMFELTPADEDAYALEDFIPGRDVSVSTVLTERDDGLIFRIKVRNETERPMETLHMEPFVPEGHVSAPSEAFVNLSPYGSRSIEFVLRPESRSRADVEIECAQCHGTFIVDRNVQRAICPWCHQEVDVGDALSSRSGPPSQESEEPADTLDPVIGTEGEGDLPPARRRRTKKKVKGGQEPQASGSTCQVCVGKGRVMVRGRKGKLKEQVCPRCKGDGTV